MSQKNALVERLKVVAARYTQSEIARRTGTWVSNVHHYLHGTRVPADFLLALVDTCGVNPHWLLTGEGSPWVAEQAPPSTDFSRDVQRLSRSLHAASRLKLGELFSDDRTRVLAEINQALEAHQRAEQQVSDHVDATLGELWDRITDALNAHEFKGDALALGVARGHLASFTQLARLSTNPLRQLESLGMQARLAVNDSRFEQALEFRRRSFLMAFSALGPKKASFHDHSHGYATSLARNGHFHEARIILQTALPLARAAGNDPTWTAFDDVFREFCASQIGQIAGALESARQALQRPGAAQANGMEDAYPMVMEIALLSGRMNSQEAMRYGPNTLQRRRYLYVWGCWTENVSELRKVLSLSMRGVLPKADYIQRLHRRWRRIAQWVHQAVWRRTKGLWREVLDWDDREFSIHPARESAVKLIRACQVARLCGEGAKARELLPRAEDALHSMPAGMDVFILERATHHRNALALSDTPAAARKLKQLRAQAQAWFRDHAARGYACFSGYGL